MRKYIFSIIVALLSLPVAAQQRQSQAKTVLDNAAEAFRKAGGVQAEFAVKTYNNGQLESFSDGLIRLKGEKFLLKTSEATTWFDGTTQWSYMDGSDEVNISNPTQEELQSINPYALLYSYRKGFSYALGKVADFHGKPVFEVILTATDRKQSFSRIVLYVARNTYQPVFISLQQPGAKNRSEITVTAYQIGKKYADADFVFDKKKFPKVEIIDLR
ncbi:LolA-like putative outer membrane lipoprotein chaperone [Bacteroides pyogenes]|uniref:LolA-like putative outer membrane lipoprotein chaperone n=1 Tax=Bacteroides pyogenes TaxID=310300 RepID=UPI001F2AF389|nr:LolA-like putative outer membrane lipoprotein chaperone [Bacteroides pyogenes]MCF2708363.1 hypothetical protein [Bacteroides pyogenes]